MTGSPPHPPSLPPLVAWSGVLDGVRRWWHAHDVKLLRMAIVLLGALAVLKLGSEFWRLLMDTGRLGANDLKLRYLDVHRWFAGLPVYEELRSAVYPPASYAILWPLLGWLSVDAARWLWALTSILALVWLTRLVLEACGATTVLERTLVALIPLSMNATGVTIGNGQLILHCLPALVVAILLVQRRGDPRWGVDLLAAFLFMVTLVKPNVSAPFFWAFLFVPGRLRPAALAVGGYLALTLFAVSFQPTDLGTLLAGWQRRSSDLVTSQGYGNLQIWFSTIGLPRYGLAASIGAIAALGVWTYSHRNRDPWIVLGVAALTARLSVYHLLYDDLLILLPMVALFRVSKRTAASGRDVVAGILLAITTAAMLAPARLSFDTSRLLHVYTVGHTLVWLSVLAFLLFEGSRELTDPMIRGGQRQVSLAS